MLFELLFILDYFLYFEDKALRLIRLYHIIAAHAHWHCWHIFTPYARDITGYLFRDAGDGLFRKIIYRYWCCSVNASGIFHYWLFSLVYYGILFVLVAGHVIYTWIAFYAPFSRWLILPYIDRYFHAFASFSFTGCFMEKAHGICFECASWCYRQLHYFRFSLVLLLICFIPLSFTQYGHFLPSRWMKSLITLFRYWLFHFIIIEYLFHRHWLRLPSALGLHASAKLIFRGLLLSLLSYLLVYRVTTPASSLCMISDDSTLASFWYWFRHMSYEAE